MFFLNSIGLPIPYKHETDATTIISFLPERSEEVVLNLNFSISSFFTVSDYVVFLRKESPKMIRPRMIKGMLNHCPVEKAGRISSNPP